MPPKNKTPDYTRKAIDKYNSKYDRITVNFPKGTKEAIKDLTGDTAGGFAVKCVINELERLGWIPDEQPATNQEKTTE
jgi:hypothetical protein